MGPMHPANTRIFALWPGRAPRDYDGVGPVIVLLVEDVIVFVLELCLVPFRPLSESRTTARTLLPMDPR